MIDQPFAKIVESVAAKTPTPGGGAVAALAAALGIGLAQMVVRFSRGKKANAEREGDLQAAEEFLSHHLQRVLPMAERDCASFDRVSAAYQLPKDSEEQKGVRNRAIEEAMVGAMVVPEELLHLVRDVIARLDSVRGCIGKAIASDLGAGCEMLFAAARAAFLNVRINANLVQDRARVETAATRTNAVFVEVQRHAESLRSTVDKLLAA